MCEYFGKPDDCYELTTLRHYRDNWLRKQPGGEALVRTYYDSAPLLVAKLKQSPHYADYCEKLMEQYIRPCIALIQAHEYERCKTLYVAMVEYLKAAF